MPQIVQEVLRSPGQPLSTAMQTSAQSLLASEFTGVPTTSASSLPVPHSLNLGPRGDRHEQQADRVAEASNRQPKSSDSKFGSAIDLTGVRIHSGALAIESARAVNAMAYAVGDDVVWGATRHSPEAGAGKQMLMHELTHVVQQRIVGGAHRGVVQRVGFFESIARFFGGGTFPLEELKAYIEGLRGTNNIEDKNDSDNKARAAVQQGLHKTEDAGIRALLVQEMLSGYTGGDDQKAILTIL